MKVSLAFFSGAAVSAALVFSLRSGSNTGQATASRPQNPAVLRAINSPGGGSPSTVSAFSTSGSGFSQQLNHRFRSDRARAILDTFDRASPADRAALINASLMMNPADPERKFVVNLLFQRWAEVDPLEAAVHFGTLSVADKVGTIESFSSAWAQHDPDAATKWAQGLPPSKSRTLALRQTFEKLAVSDAQGALSRLAELDAQTARAVSGAVYAAWADTDPKAAVAATLKAVSSGTIDTSAVQAVAARWADRNPEAALKWLSSSQAPFSHLGLNFAASLVESLSTTDPAGTLAAVLAMPNKNESTDLLRLSALKGWVPHDPGAAAAWIKTQDADAAAQLVSAAARTNMDPSKAPAWLKLAESLADGPARDSAMTSFIKQWTSIEPEQALAYISNLPDSTLVGKFMPAVAQGIAQTDPELALTIALDLAPDSSRQALLTVANAWGRKDPVEAIARISQLPESDVRSQMFQSTAAAWAATDAKAASGWAQTISNANSRDAVLAMLAQTLATRNPVLARQNAELIANAALRQSMLSKMKP